MQRGGKKHKGTATLADKSPSDDKRQFIDFYGAIHTVFVVWKEFMF